MQFGQSSDAAMPEGDEESFQPLTAEQAAQWRQKNPALSVWRVVFWQVAVGVALAALVGGWSGRVSLAVSVFLRIRSGFSPGCTLCAGADLSLDHRQSTDSGGGSFGVGGC